MARPERSLLYPLSVPAPFRGVRPRDPCLMGGFRACETFRATERRSGMSPPTRTPQFAPDPWGWRAFPPVTHPAVYLNSLPKAQKNRVFDPARWVFYHFESRHSPVHPAMPRHRVPFPANSAGFAADGATLRGVQRSSAAPHSAPRPSPLHRTVHREQRWRGACRSR
jgi:hypothetical protein